MEASRINGVVGIVRRLGSLGVGVGGEVLHRLRHGGDLVRLRAGISTANSSSMAITTSTVSSESRPRSAPNDAFGPTFAGSTLLKFFTTDTTRSVTSDLSRYPAPYARASRGERERGERELCAREANAIAS